MNRPRILRQEMVTILSAVVDSLEPLHPTLSGRQLTDFYDFGATLTVLQEARVILFNSQQALALRPALDRFSEDVAYHLPFERVWLQFTDPIPEAELFEVERPPGHEEMGIETDAVLGIVLAQDETDSGQMLNNCSAVFSSTSVNRVLWANEPRAHLRLHEQAEQNDVGAANKRILRNFAIACVAYINCENIRLQHQSVLDKVNRKRRRQGKRELEPYYICQLRGVDYEQDEDSAGSGTSHSFRYDVRGHFRRLPDGRLTWVRPHQRGLTHDLYKPKAYRAD